MTMAIFAPQLLLDNLKVSIWHDDDRSHLDTIIITCLPLRPSQVPLESK